MKYLEYDTVDQLNAILNSMDVKQCRLFGRLDIYSCKPQKTDRRLKDYMGSKLDRYRQDEEAYSPPEHHGYFFQLDTIGNPEQCQPLPVNDPMTIKLVAHFIGTMNLAFPDYDFSDLRPQQFMLVPFQAFSNDLDSRLHPLGEYTRRAVKQRLFMGLKDSLSKDGEEQQRRGKRRGSTELDFESIEELVDIFTWTPDPGEEPGADEGLVNGAYYFIMSRRQRRLGFLQLKTVSDHSILQEEELTGDSELESADEYWGTAKGKAHLQYMGRIAT